MTPEHIASERTPIRNKVRNLTVLAALAQAWSIAAVGAYSVKDDMEAARAYAATPGHKDAAASRYISACELIAKNKMDLAMVALEEVNRLDPRLAAAYSSYAYCQLWSEHYLEAIKTLDKAIGLDSSKPIYFYRRALCAISTERMDEAIVALNHALEINPNDADCLRLRARYFRRLPTADARLKAIADLSRLIKNNSYVVESLCERGKLYARSGDEAKAMQDFNEALRIKPDAGDAFFERASLFYTQRNYRPALENYIAATMNNTSNLHFCQTQIEICKQYLVNPKPAAADTNDFGPGRQSR